MNKQQFKKMIKYTSKNTSNKSYNVFGGFLITSKFIIPIRIIDLDIDTIDELMKSEGFIKDLSEEMFNKVYPQDKNNFKKARLLKHYYYKDDINNFYRIIDIDNKKYLVVSIIFDTIFPYCYDDIYVDIDDGLKWGLLADRDFQVIIPIAKLEEKEVF